MAGDIASVNSPGSRTTERVGRRPDIQGLRAIAVLVVVAFHAGLPVPGGFIGVDVFFVISGFVITGMLHREWSATRRLRLGRFYLRRFKRLTPALALVVAVTMAISAFVLSPFGTQTNAARTGIGAMLLVANFVIARTTGDYFDAPAESNPLLNMWSLSVEEQFYLVFPALIALSWYLARKRGMLRLGPYGVVGSIAIASFALAVAGSTGLTFPGSGVILGFYSPFTRAWEFAAGAFLALALTSRRPLTRGLTSTAGVMGLLLLAVGLWFINDAMPFPGLWTLIPVTATLLLLLAGTDGRAPTSRLLSTGPMVAVGDWSYSIYLWHWPFIVFAVYIWPLSIWAPILAALISTVPALASYYLVEQPIRFSAYRGPLRTTLLITAVVLPPVLLSASVGLTAVHYWRPQYETGAIPVAYEGDTSQGGFSRFIEQNSFPCSSVTADTRSGQTDQVMDCRKSKPGAIDIAIIGDSHAQHLFPGVSEALPSKNVAYYSGLYSDRRAAEQGEPSPNEILGEIVDDSSITTVIVSAYWSLRHVSGAHLNETLQVLAQAGKRVFVTDDVPAFPFDASSCKYRKAPLIPINQCSIPTESFQAIQSESELALQQAVGNLAGVTLLPTAAFFCDAIKCDMTRDGRILFRDNNHLNVDGSRYVARKLLTNYPSFRRALSIS